MGKIIDFNEAKAKLGDKQEPKTKESGVGMVQVLDDGVHEPGTIILHGYGGKEFVIPPLTPEEEALINRELTPEEKKYLGKQHDETPDDGHGRKM